MGTEIKTWQIANGLLQPINTNLKQEGRTEPYDLEPWLESNPEIIGADIVIIGRQVMSKSGPIDLLGIDKNGNLIIIELKRDQLPREALAQAIDYASDVAEWSIEKIAEVCSTYSNKPLDDVLNERFPDIDLENININTAQRIVLIGFSVESSLERMIEWLSDGYSVNINAVVLNYIKTASGDELLAKTTIISEELEQERVKKQKKFEIPMSDEPGKYEEQQLKKLLIEYLTRKNVTNQRIREVLFPACLQKKNVTREELKRKYLEVDPTAKETSVGYYLTAVSSQLGMTKNDFLRQVLAYEYPRYHWEKDNFSIRDEYRNLVKQILEEIENAKE